MAARNHSPTTELSLTFESLRLEHQQQPPNGEASHQKEDQEERRLQNEDSQLLWANNTISGTDQSNECNDGLITNNNGYHPSLNDNQLIPSLQEHHHLINCMDNNNSQQLASQYTCTCHTIPCECHVTPGSHDLTTPTTQQPLLTCRQEAMYNNDITVEELAGYFDELLHLPKPMSVMAELMYT